MRELTSAQCDNIALSQAGFLTYVNRLEIAVFFTDLSVGDWFFKVIGYHTESPYVVLLSSNKRTADLLNKGRISKFMAEGLSRDQAIKLNRSACKYKFELAPLLPGIITDGIDKLAITSHPQWVRGECSIRETIQWHDHWKECLSFDLPPQREIELIKMVEALTS